MKILMFVVAGLLATAAASVRVEPSLVTLCQSGFGQAKVIWDVGGDGPVTIHAGDAAMTGPEGTAGSTSTGWWVADGMVFSVRNAAGETVGAARAVVRCGANAWWPLAVGNEWHFRVTSNFYTGHHTMWRIARSELVNGVEWFELVSGAIVGSRFRTDSEGRIYSLSDVGQEMLLLDPSSDQTSRWKIRERRPEIVTAAGTFLDGLNWWQPNFGELTGGFARGVGPISYRTSSFFGPSNGQFTQYELLEAVIDGARLLPNYPRLELILETQLVDFGARSARNCLVSGSNSPNGLAFRDRSGVYRPCMEASIRGGGTGGRLVLLDPAGRAIFQTAAEGWTRIPLYSSPDVGGTPVELLPAGKYSVVATLNGNTVSLPLEIR